MDRIFSKYRKKTRKVPAAATSGGSAGTVHPPATPSLGVALPNATPSTVAAALIATPSVVAALPTVTPTVAPSAIVVPPILTSSGKRNFWMEAVETLKVNGTNLPEEWQTATFDEFDKYAVGLVAAKMEECKQKQWKVMIKGETVVLRDLFEKTLGWVTTFAAVGNTAVQYDPVNAALPWAGFRFLLQVAQNEMDTYCAMMAGLERATWLTLYCSAREQLYNEHHAGDDKNPVINNAFAKDLVDLYAAILRFLIQAHEFYTKRTAARIGSAFVQHKNWVEELKRAIDDKKARMEDYARLIAESKMHQDLKDALGMLDPVVKYVLEEAKRRQDKEREQLMSWLSDIEYAKDHKANYRDILKDSGKWMLESKEFRSWEEGGKLLLLQGIPGAGKTKLTSSVIEHLKHSEDNRTVAYFYCIRDTKQPKKEDPEEILRAILKQLVISLPNGESDPVQAKYEEAKRQSEKEGSKSITALTLEECASFIMKLATCRPVTIVIDALDECRDSKFKVKGRYELLETLKRITEDKPGTVRVFLSSRHDADTARRLQQYTSTTTNTPGNGADILRFIESEVCDLMTRHGGRWEGDEEDNKNTIVEALNKGAGGMFRWAALQIEHLYYLETMESVRDRLGKLPKTLHGLYTEIYGRISTMQKKDFSLAKRALSWLLCAHEQLSSRELVVAMSRGPTPLVTESQILNLCRNLVVLNEVSGSFELAHLSVREYLETHEEYKDGQPHVLVAKRCIDLFEGEIPQEKDSQAGLYRYASLYWADHYTRTLQMDGALTNVVENFFRDKGVNPAFQNWAKLAEVSIETLPWRDKLGLMLRDTHYKPLSVICVFGFPEILDPWIYTAPKGGYFRNSDDMVVHLAIKWGNEEVVRLLLRNDPQLTLDKIGYNPPFWAATFQQRAVLEMLKQLPGGLDAEDDIGWTALHWMVFIGYWEGLEILLEMGAGLNKTDKAKWTPMHWAAFLGREAEAELLMGGKASCNAQDNDGWTPFQWAKFTRHEVVAKLLENEAHGSFDPSLVTRYTREMVRIHRASLSSNTVLILLEI